MTALTMRARNGDNNALARLKEKCTDDPSHSDAIQALANVYSSFEQFNQAAELLTSCLETVPDEERTILAVNASIALCKDGKASEAIDLLLERHKKETIESRHVALYRELARAGGKANLSDIEIAFLEKVLKITPSDPEARFRLAYVYSSNELHQLAAHHYELVVKHSDWVSASNNLGVTYGDLGLKGNQYKLFHAVSEKYPLAKANLAQLYANVGSLAEAEVLARSALSTPDAEADSQVAIDRARYVLNEIEATKKHEKEAIEKIAEDTKSDREFMSAYADAYCTSPLPDDRGIFATAHGDLALVRDAHTVKGEGTLRRQKNLGLGALGAIRATTTGGTLAEQDVTIYSVTLSATLRGQSGTFVLEIAPEEVPGTGLINSRSSPRRIINGLMYFKDNGNVIQFLEREEQKRTIVSAHRKR